MCAEFKLLEHNLWQEEERYFHLILAGTSCVKLLVTMVMLMKMGCKIFPFLQEAWIIIIIYNG